MWNELLSLFLWVELCRSNWCHSHVTMIQNCLLIARTENSLSALWLFLWTTQRDEVSFVVNSLCPYKSSLKFPLLIAITCTLKHPFSVSWSHWPRETDECLHWSSMCGYGLGANFSSLGSKSFFRLKNFTQPVEMPEAFRNISVVFAIRLCIRYFVKKG